MTGFLEIVLLLSAPLLLAATGELLLERAGSIQIGLEGTMLVGAWVAFTAGRSGLSPQSCLALAALGGLLAGLLFALFAVARRADPILVGTVWNLLALGATAFAYRLSAGETGSVLQVATLPRGVLGVPDAVAASFLAPVALHAWLARTRAGLRLASAGENPEALRSLGLSVVAVRTGAAAASGVLGALGGALLVVTVSPTFVEGITAGRGFLALSLVVFARWRPLALLPASLLLGCVTALQYRLQAGGFGLPYAFFLALPGLVSLAALALASTRGGAPKALGSPAP